jgi:hypothetical protein
MEMMNCCSTVIPFKYLVFSLEFSWVLDEIILTWRFALNLILMGHMLDLSLSSWRVWYEKVWATVYLVLSYTRVLEIYCLKILKLLHDEFLYDESLNSYHSHIYMLDRLGSPLIDLLHVYALSVVNLCWYLRDLSCF